MIDYFKRLQNPIQIQGYYMRSISTKSNRALEASYKVSELIAKAQEPYTIAESIILPVCFEILKTMIGSDEVKSIEKVSLSNNTISRRSLEKTLI